MQAGRQVVSAIPHTLRFAAAAGVKHLLTFHHDPGHDDLTLDRLIEEAQNSFDLPFQLSPGTEGATLDLGGR
ncbi:MAG: hypothetical protein HY002_05540 [Candidatus Rokubacteria bacterium]|nr:hypothetical protein [Candidatus Rokubacteria bacterium]